MTKPKISSKDIELLRESRSRDRYANLSAPELDAYRNVHLALSELGTLVVEALGGADIYQLRLTSGFHLKSGVRGALPKDLWFGIFRRENETVFVGNPQLYMIISGRGVEYGFAASTHPSDFSNQEIKERLRAAAPNIYRLLPEPGSIEAHALEYALSGEWKYRRKSRLETGRSDFTNLDDWLTYFRSDAGMKEGGGCIAQYLYGEKIDQSDLAVIVQDMANLFKPLMESVSASKISSAPLNSYQVKHEPSSLSELFEKFGREFAEARIGPFQETQPLWSTAEAIKNRINRLACVQQRPYIVVQWSLGKGNWANVPWIALLNTNVTKSTQSGLYIVLLFAQDLSAIYVSLGLGITDLVNELGQRAALSALRERVEVCRAQLSDIASGWVKLDDDIDLRTEGWRSKNYEAAAVAYARLPLGALPTDEQIIAIIETLLTAYDRLVNDVPAEDVETSVPMDVSGPIEVEEEPYLIEDAISDLFLEKSDFERILSTLSSKKNLILQGPPGVGKSFIAKRLAYALMQRRAPSRLENVQFHQSYAYEDFVQGYRPSPEGGFRLRDGIFMRFCKAAQNDVANVYVMIIDEINRGNLSKIFGELMLLIEPDKRHPSWGTRLAYAQPDDEKFFIPDNLYVIGLMNTADRSLSMVDYALRRRFAFVTLAPQFRGPQFRNSLSEAGVPEDVIDRLIARIEELNAIIAGDTANLGHGFQIGHSFFVPAAGSSYFDGWYERVIETEIRPLLEEYWFDDPEKANNLASRLLGIA